MQPGIALYGLGTVGSGLMEIIDARRESLCARHDLALRLRHVVVRDPARVRDAPVDPALLTTDWRAPLHDPAVSIVVEAMGGLEPAGTIVRRALEAGKSVVTANKALIAARGSELESLARAGDTTLRYEGAVCGAIPVLHALRGALVGNRIARIHGILNGTTNYVLTRMAEERVSLHAALTRAQALGFAEADPRADITGVDAAQKLVILAYHAFGRWMPVECVAREGIEGVTRRDLDRARRRGRVIKLVAEGAIDGGGTPALRVAPTTLPASHPFAAVRDEYNAVLLEGDFAGPLFFMGRGAGSRPTASAVYADLVEAAMAERAREPASE